MACTNMSSSSSHMVMSPKGLSKEGSKIRSTFSGSDLCNQVKMQQFYSDNHIRHSVNRMHASKTEPKLKNSWSFKVFKLQLSGSFVPKSLPNFSIGSETSEEATVADDHLTYDEMDVEEKKRGMYKGVDWVERIKQILSRWIPKKRIDEVDNDCDEDEEECEVDSYDDEVEGKKETDGETFSKFLKKVSWSDTKLLSQSAFLCNMAYAISEIKAVDLRRYFGLEFVTSSVEMKAEAAATKATLDQDCTCPSVDASPATKNESGKSGDSDKNCLNNRPSVAYEIATSAIDLSHLGSEKQDEDNRMTFESDESKSPHEEVGPAPRVYKTEVLAVYETASTMTAVFAEGEKKEEAAIAHQSLPSSPVEWFVCDDSRTYTRYIVIQGSDSLASWQSNLQFEPTKFEGTDALVHRGTYEAAKAIFKQLKPIVMEHQDKYGEQAKFSFTGHCFGGSLSVLVNLMLLTRKVVKPSALRPVVTFGSPFVLCGGHKILDVLGLNEDDIHCVIMHRDIVPRAFSCNYPDHVTELLKRLHETFRSHPCLIRNKFMYSPMGKIFILQPKEISSPRHPLLPSGIALYALENLQCCSSKNALMAFLNSPHPLETLSNLTAYGSNGTISRDHDSSNYLKAINGVLRLHTKAVIRSARRQMNPLWPILTSQSTHAWGSCPEDK